MRPQAICLLFACLLLATTAGAQEIMSVNIQNRCVFTGSVMEEELYRFEQNNRVSEWVQEILDLGGTERNFELVQTNVENVSAVVDGNTRYLLYSKVGARRRWSSQGREWATDRAAEQAVARLGRGGGAQPQKKFFWEGGGPGSFR